jgi:uncharacterized membrane protein (DUF106 family)
VNWFNAQLTALGDLVLAPFSAWSPHVVLIVLSVVSGVVMTVVFRYTSNQKALKRVADRTKAQLLCMRIFKDDIRVALRCQGTLLKAIGARLWHSLPPMLVLIVPFLLILTQLSLRYEKRPLEPGDSAIVTVELSPDTWSSSNRASIQAPSGVAVETPALRDAGEHSVYWRLKLNAPTDDPLRLRVGGDFVEKTLVGSDNGDALCTVSARRPGPGFWDRLLFPGESGFAADSAVQAIDVRYPPRSTAFFGIDIPWWATFLILSMATALVVRPFLKVQF